PDLHSFPTRRSSDLAAERAASRAPGGAEVSQSLRQRTLLLTAHCKVLLASLQMLPGDKSRLPNQHRLLKEATGLFGRQVIAEGRSEEHTSELQSPYD